MFGIKIFQIHPASVLRVFWISKITGLFAADIWKTRSGKTNKILAYAPIVKDDIASFYFILIYLLLITGLKLSIGQKLMNIENVPDYHHSHILLSFNVCSPWIRICCKEGSGMAMETPEVFIHYYQHTSISFIYRNLRKI